MNRISFQQLFSALPSPHMILDRDLNYAGVNGAYEAATMTTGAELIGRHLFEVFPNDGESGRRLRESLERVLASGEPDTLAYIEYDIPRPADRGGGFEKRYWTAVHSPLKDEHGEVAYILQNTVDITELVRLRAAASIPHQLFSSEVALVQRAREAEEAYQGTRSQTDEFQRLFQNAPGIVALLQGPEHIFTFANDAYRSFVGGRDLLGLPARNALPELDDQGFIAMLDGVFRTGEALTSFDTQVFLRDRTAETLREVYLDFSYHPIRDRNGVVSGIFIQGYERTDAVRARQRQRLLIDELNHRVKNTLSTVQSLARRSFRTTVDREEARLVFEARILALSNAHNLLSDRHWESADLKTIVRLELDAFGDHRFETEGDTLALTPKAAIALAMVFHELASNAVKYGSLSAPGGRLRVGWRLENDDLSLRWHEAWERPEVEMKPGFGMRMLDRIVTGELEGRLGVDFGSDGLIWTIDIPRKEIEDLAATTHA